MTTWTDIVTATNSGTGTSSTTLNGGNNYVTSNMAGCLKEVVPVQAPSGAITAGESSLQRFTVTSTSIGAIAPKNIAMTPVQAVLGTGAAAMVPIARGFVFNTPLPMSNVPITFSAAPYVANTVGYMVGANLVLTTEGASDRENFYDCVSSSTSTGTGTGAVSLGNITINGASALTMVYEHIGAGTVTASKSMLYRLNVSSADLTPIQSVSAYGQPVASGLGTAVTLLQPDQRFNSEYIALRPTATLAATNTNDIGLTAAGNAVWGCAYVR